MKALCIYCARLLDLGELTYVQLPGALDWCCMPCKARREERARPERSEKVEQDEREDRLVELTPREA